MLRVHFLGKTVNLVADLDKSSAELFHKLCSFGWRIHGALFPLIFDSAKPIYADNGLGLYSLIKLDSIGLIQISDVLGFKLSNQSRQLPASYNLQSVVLTFPTEEGNDFELGQVMMTPSGMELARIVKPTSIQGFFEFIYDKWAKESLLPSR